MGNKPVGKKVNTKEVNSGVYLLHKYRDFYGCWK